MSIQNLSKTVLMYRATKKHNIIERSITYVTISSSHDFFLPDVVMFNDMAKVKQYDKTITSEEFGLSMYF